MKWWAIIQKFKANLSFIFYSILMFMLRWYVASIGTFTVYRICSPEKTIPQLPVECRAINLSNETLRSNTAFYAPTYLPCQQLIWASLLQLALAFLCVGRMCLCKPKPALASSSCRWLLHLSTVHCVIKYSKSSPFLLTENESLMKECILISSPFCLTTQHACLSLWPCSGNWKE